MKFSLLTAGLLVPIFLSGCAPKSTPVDGQILLVGTQGETVRLSGVKVITGLEQDLTNRLQHLREEIDSLNTDVQQELKKAETQAVDLDKKLMLAQAKMKEAESALKKIEDYIAYSKRQMTASEESMRLMRAAARQAKARENEKLNTQLLKAENDSSHWKGEVETARKLVEELQTQSSKSQKRIASLKGRLEPQVLAAKYFEEDFQTPGFPEATTDAEGRFRLNMNLKIRPMIVVRAERSVPTNTVEYYFWAERVNSTNILLVNENLHMSWKIKELGPKK